MIPGSANPLLLATTQTAAADVVDNIPFSVRFNSADSAEMYRTPSTAGNQRTWTFSAWIKNAIDLNQSTTGDHTIFGVTVGNSQDLTIDIVNDQLVVALSAQIVFIKTNFFLRDPSAWFHLVVGFDTTQSVGADRIKVYLNGERVTNLVTQGVYTINQNAVHAVNGTATQRFVKKEQQNNNDYGDFYLANIHMADGYQHDASEFGFFDGDNVWQPKAYTGSYGTNGFHLDFSNTATLATLGADASGNGNDFTLSNVVAGPAFVENSASVEFDGVSDYLTITDASALGGFDGDFTIEFWFKGSSQTSYAVFLEAYTSSAGQRWSIQADANAANMIWVRDTNIVLTTSNASPFDDAWHHHAVVRSGSTITYYFDGASAGTETYSGAISACTDLIIGAYSQNANSYEIDGYLSNVRIVSGTAVYTSSFTPSATPLTAIAGTVLLTCQDGTIRDNSNVGYSLTASGTVNTLNEGPFGEFCASFDGNGDFISAASSSDFGYGSSDFTWEAWIYAKDLTNSRGVLAHGTADGVIHNTSSGGSRLVFYNGSTGAQGNLYTVGFGELEENVWYHIAAVRSQGTTYLYTNGELITSQSDPYNYLQNTFRIGNTPATNIGDWYGYISNVRITKGQAIYTQAFTPSLDKLTTTSQGAVASNVKLLTCQEATIVDNSDSGRYVTPNYDTVAYTANPKTSNYSIVFDGTDDYVTFPHDSAINLDSNDFTFEFWGYHSSTQGTQTYVGKAYSTSNDPPIAIEATSSGTQLTVRYSVSGGRSNTVYTQNAANAFTPNTWNHIAVTRSGSSIKAYVNGAEVISATQSSALLFSSSAWYLGGLGTGNYLQGKISNFRYTHGQVVYSSEFTPSSEELTTTSQGATASNVALLTAQDYKIQDNSSSARTLTAYNGAKPSSESPFFTSLSADFGSGNNHLEYAATDDLNLRASDFTIEFFYYQYTAYDAQLVSKTNNLQGFYPWSIKSNGYRIRFSYCVGSTFTNFDTPNYTVARDIWQHVAVVRNGTSLKTYIDGVEQASTTITGALNENTLPLTLGGGNNISSSYYLNGYLSNVRVSNSARYTATFTPPTADFTADDNTLFLGLQNSSLEDVVGDHVLTVAGDAAAHPSSPFEPATGADVCLDSPTNFTADGLVRGNYCTLNPLDAGWYGSAKNGNLDFETTGARPNCMKGTMAVRSGKWLWEVTATNNITGGNSNPPLQAGLINDDLWEGEAGNTVYGIYEDTNFDGCLAYSFYNGNKYIDGSGSSFDSDGGAGSGDTIGFALDLDAGRLEVYKNGDWIGILADGLSGLYMPFVESDTATTGQTATVNFGQRGFSFPVAGYQAWCTENFETPVIPEGDKQMSVVLYSGTGQGTQTLTLPFEPAMTIHRCRTNDQSSYLHDSVRGIDDGEALRTMYNNTPGYNQGNYTISVSGTSLSVGDTGGSHFNSSNRDYLFWAFNGGGNSNYTYPVTVVQSKYRFAGYAVNAFTLDLQEGSTYVFDQSDQSNSGHPLRFSTTSNGTHSGGTEYTTGVTVVGTPGTAGAYTQIIVPSGAPTLYYYCSNHSGMGGQANTNVNGGNTNFDGSIPAVVKANPTAGFSTVVVTEDTGNGQTVGHGLNKKPELIIQKSISDLDDWTVWCTKFGDMTTKYMYLNDDAPVAQNLGFGLSEPTSSVMTVNHTTTEGNSSVDVVYYLFTSIEGYCRIGFYEGQGNTYGEFEYTGFRPRWIMFKNIDDMANLVNYGSWKVVDSTRYEENEDDPPSLYMNRTYQEGRRGQGTTDTFVERIDFLSNGFKLGAASSYEPETNLDNRTYMYIAFAEHPFKTSRAR